MDSDEDQQALAWQQIIKNRAFYNVRVQRGESWVDAACRTLDELVDQKEQAENATPRVVWRERALEAERHLMEARRELEEEKSRSQFFAARTDEANGERDAEVSRADYLYKKFAKLMSDYQDVEDERDEWKDRALDAEHYAQAVSASNRDNADRASRAENARDTAATRADQLEKKLAKVMSHYQDTEDERDEWKARAEKAEADRENIAEEFADFRVEVVAEAVKYRELNPPVFDVDVERTIRAEFVEEGFRTKTTVEYRVVRAVCELFGVEAKQSVDPVEAKAAEFYDLAGRVGDDIWAACRNIAAHVLGQEDRHVDQ